MKSAIPKPPYDPQLAANLAAGPLLEMLPLNDASLPKWRDLSSLGVASIAEGLADLDLVHEERTIEGPRGQILLSIIRPREAGASLPAMYTIHGGGMIMGDRFSPIAEIDQLKWVAEHRLVLISPEYRLAPEYPAPAGVEDCYAGLKWAADHSVELGIDASRIILAGGSGGGGLAAGTALLARDLGGPALLAQLLICPQLDDRHITVSSKQFSLSNGAMDGWIRESNKYAWNLILGEGHEDREVSIYAAPARATDLSGLPPAYIDLGEAEVFRDEDVAYASLLWASGVSAELHVWPGGHHGFDVYSVDVPVVQDSRMTRSNWVRRILGRQGIDGQAN